MHAREFVLDARFYLQAARRPRRAVAITWLCCVVRRRSVRHSAGLSQFLVDMKMPGIVSEPIVNTAG